MANMIPTELNWVIEEILSLIMTYLVLTDTEVRYVERSTVNEASGLTWFQMRAWRMTAFSITRTARPLTCILARSIWKLQVSVWRCNYITHHSSCLEITEIMRNTLRVVNARVFGVLRRSLTSPFVLIIQRRRQRHLTWSAIHDVVSREINP